MCFRLTWWLTLPCIEILFFNKTTQELTQPDTLKSFLSKATSMLCHGQQFYRTLIQSNICGITCKGGWTVKAIDLKTPMILNIPYEGTGMLFQHIFLQTLVSSMGRRCAAVLEAQEGPTNY
ncbi:hypothetical protein ElyMa_005263200 [Elysia marginata]|uniref:Uncharacterized protein n=1 Tax=Elysia marginata TaxID=1093978 RepID=A0AAV4JX92_9GAST|nr:hypothetical protein ElyMa_005263200 [Elysia marginata]